jgi:hypothetical protein
MNTEKEKFDELDALIGEAMHSEPGKRIPGNFTDVFIRKVQRRIMWRELLTDFSFKLAIVVFSLTVFAGIYYFVILKDSAVLITFVKGSWKLISGIAVVILFTVVTDQVFLKYLFRKRQEQ